MRITLTWGVTGREVWLPLVEKIFSVSLGEGWRGSGGVLHGVEFEKGTRQKAEGRQKGALFSAFSSLLSAFAKRISSSVIND